MKYIECEIPEQECYVIPISDLHIGDPNFEKIGRPILNETLLWLEKQTNAKIFLNGDIFNCASRQSKTSPFESDINEYQTAIDIFEPVKDKIIGAIDGNHEARMIDDYGISPLQLFCRELKIPYSKWSAVVRFKVGKRKDSNRWYQNYFGYFHHTTGGGSTIGGKINRVTKLRELVESIDFYCGSHNHQLAIAPQDVFYPSMQDKTVKKRRIWYIDCGSYLDWNDSYAEKNMLAPTKLGSPKIKLDGRQHNHECYVSI